MKRLLLLILLSFQAYIFAQQIPITGKVLSGNVPIGNATIYLLKESDSTIINYTSSSEAGNFNLKVDKISQPTILKVNSDDYDEYFTRFEKIEGPISLGNISLEKMKSTEIQEVVIQSAAPPVKIKKDTVEFNAASFPVRPDSNIEQLIKGLPGFDIDADGKITANGKDVDQILVNGKPFFDKDGQVALKNIPADIIKKVQVTGTKTKEEELNGEPAKSENLTLNFAIDEKKNLGYMIRLTGGYGTDDRYEASGIASYFKNNTKISLLGASNNINSSGFSNDEVFDSMGNGRNSRLLSGSLSGGNTTKGIQKSSTFGINYADKISDNADLDNLSVMVTDNNLETSSTVSRETYLPTDILKTDSKNSGFNENKDVKFNGAARIKFDKRTDLYISTGFTNSNGNATNESSSSTFSNNANDLLNQSTSKTQSDSNQNNANVSALFSKRFLKKGRVLSASLAGVVGQSNTDKVSLLDTEFFQTGNNDYRNQLSRNRTTSNNFTYGFDYSEPISDSARVVIGVDFRTDYSNAVRDVNDFDQLTGGYDSHNSLLSNSMLQEKSSLVPELSYRLEKKKYSVRAFFNVDILKMDVDAQYNGVSYGLSKDFILPEYNFGFYYKFSDKARLNLNHSANYSIPTAVQLTPYQDVSNPLLTQTGNPELKNTWMNSTRLNFNDFNQVKNLNLFANANFNYYNNQITSQRSYDSEGKQFLTYTNISGNKNASLGFGATKTYKFGANKLSISPRFRMSYSYQKGFIDQTIYSSKTYSITPSIGLSYEIKDKLLLKPSYNFSYNSSKYDNYTVDSRNTSTNRFKLEMTNYIGENLVIGNDFDYSTNSNIAAGFKKNFYFWNASVGYTFLQKQLTAKVKVYDMLNQNQSVQRIITDTYIEDRDDLILKRYIMFSLTYKLNKFGGKNTANKKSKRNFNDD